MDLAARSVPKLQILHLHLKAHSRPKHQFLRLAQKVLVGHSHQMAQLPTPRLLPRDLYHPMHQTDLADHSQMPQMLLKDLFHPMHRMAPVAHFQMPQMLRKDLYHPMHRMDPVAHSHLLLKDLDHPMHRMAPVDRILQKRQLHHWPLMGPVDQTFPWHRLLTQMDLDFHLVPMDLGFHPNLYYHSHPTHRWLQYDSLCPKAQKALIQLYRCDSDHLRQWQALVRQCSMLEWQQLPQ